MPEPLNLSAIITAIDSIAAVLETAAEKLAKLDQPGVRDAYLAGFEAGYDLGAGLARAQMGTDGPRMPAEGLAGSAASPRQDEGWRDRLA